MFRKITRNHLENFLKRQATDKRVLNVGSGADLYNYRRFFPNAVSFDVDPNNKPNVIGDAHALPFKNEEFEVVLCAEVLEHLIDPKKAISEMRRVLKSGGTLILTTRFVYPIHDSPHDYWRFTKYGLMELFKEWEVIELISETRNFSTIAVLLQRIGFQSILKVNKLSKLILFTMAVIFNNLNFLTKKEYGDIARKNVEKDIMPSGYYMVIKKRI